MTRAIFFLLATLLGSVAHADAGKVNAMREAFARMDREDFFDGIEKANECMQSRDFACAEKQLAEVKDLADSAADQRLFALAVSNLQAEKQQAAEDQRRWREEAERRQREQAARIAAEEEAEEREQRRQRIADDEERARVIGSAIMSAGQSVAQAYTDIETSRARNQAVMDDYNESRARQQRLAEEARAEQARRDREERIAQQNYDRKRAAASAQLHAALQESRAQSQREAGISAYQQAQATTAAARTSSALLAGGVTVATPGMGNTATKSAATGSTSSSTSGGSTAAAAPAATAKAKTDSADYVASPEGVVICELKTGGKFSCTSTLGSTFFGGPNEIEGWRTPAEATAHVGGCRTPRRITWRSGYEVFGCGTGITGMSNYIDVAAKLGVTVPGRNTYWCKPLEIACARTSKP